MAEWTSGTNNQFVLLIARTVTILVESELGGKFWSLFKAATAGLDEREVTFKARIGTRQHHLMYGQKKDVSGIWIPSVQVQSLGLH
jgi:hypothetical protein